MAERRKLLSSDRVEVVDLADVGDLYYGEWTEDGERPVLTPPHEPRIRLETEYGEIYELDATFPSFEAAELLLRRIVVEGSVNMDKWRFVRVIYGSRAYVNYGAADEIAWEKEEERMAGF